MDGPLGKTVQCMGSFFHPYIYIHEFDKFNKNKHDDDEEDDWVWKQTGEAGSTKRVAKRVQQWSSTNTWSGAETIAMRLNEDEDGKAISTTTWTTQGRWWALDRLTTNKKIRKHDQLWLIGWRNNIGSTSWVWLVSASTTVQQQVQRATWLCNMNGALRQRWLLTTATVSASSSQAVISASSMAAISASTGSFLLSLLTPRGSSQSEGSFEFKSLPEVHWMRGCPKQTRGHGTVNSKQIGDAKQI